MRRRLIFLIGFSFTGKTSAGRHTAGKLGWAYVDTDELIVQKAGKPIPQIFAEDGEERFRDIERQVLQEVCQREDLVVATGGGIILDEANRDLMVRQGTVVCLEASPETIHQRLLRDAQEGTNPVVRPLLQVPDPLERIRFLKNFRQPFYAAAHWTVHTDVLTPDEAAEEVVRGWRYVNRGQPAAPAIAGSRREADAPYCAGHQADLVVKAASACYPIFMRPLAELGHWMTQAGIKGSAYLVSDENVFGYHGAAAEESLKEAGFRVSAYRIPPGEGSKSLEVLSRLYEWLLAQKPERGHAIVALGGGVVGDLAGFAAATLLRGIPYVQVPTSLLAMVDSSVGGKTAVDHPRGKNMIGAFYQPSLVLIDPTTLKTLPQRELTSGWAELIKHGLIRDAVLFRFLEEHAAALLAMEDTVTREAILRSVAIKAEIVGLDERETTGLRSLLNYGHTIAHGIEAATGYGRLLHGEAVAIGMAGAGRISRDMGLMSAETARAQEALLQRYGLPVSCQGVNKGRVREAMSLDKKVHAGKIRWALLDDIGHAILRDDVPPQIVDRSLDAVLLD